MAAKQPSNSDILKAVKQLKDMQVAQAKDIGILMNWKIAEDAYRAALAKVKSDDEQSKYQGLRDNELKKRTELIKQAGIVVALIIAILYAYATTHGVKTP
jgi:hypothetical protein